MEITYRKFLFQEFSVGDGVMGHKTKRVKRDGSVDGESLLISAR